jgi:Na+-transporting NADH:ubiquinone oxidoreductase subunit NqrE
MGINFDPTNLNAAEIYAKLDAADGKAGDKKINWSIWNQFAAAADGMFNLGEATVYAFATSLGFGLAMVLFAGLREQLALNDVPKAFKGIPIALVTASILAMAFMGFSGLV